MKLKGKKVIKLKVKAKKRRKKRNSISHYDENQDNDVSNNGNVRYAVKHLRYLADKKKEADKKKKEEKKEKIIWGCKIAGTVIGCILSVALF